VATTGWYLLTGQTASATMGPATEHGTISVAVASQQLSPRARPAQEELAGPPKLTRTKASWVVHFG